LVKSKRYLSIDIFRGLAIALMVFGNTSLIFKGRAAWANHAVDFGCTPGDLVAPMFIFAIAMTYKMAFERGIEREGKLETYTKIFRRYTCFAGIGFLFHPLFPISQSGIRFAWGTLAAIGLAGLLTLFFIHFSRLARLLISVAVLASYQVILARPVMTAVGEMSLADVNFYDGHGGFLGGIAWFGMMLLSTVVVDNFKTQKLERLFWYGLALSLAGVGLHFSWLYWGTPAYGGISKERMTTAYVLVGVGFSTLVFWFIYWLYDIREITGNKSKYLQPLAKNSFFIFLAHPFLVVAAYLLVPDSAPDAVVFAVSVLNTYLAWKLAVWMDDNGHYVII
jgi:predicted acyltransferase